MMLLDAVADADANVEVDVDAAAASTASWPNCTFRLRSFRFPNGTKRVQSNSRAERGGNIVDGVA